MNIVHIITGLSDGGAEAVLFRLCTNDHNNNHVVISLMGMGKYGSMLQAKGIDVYCINMQIGRVSVSDIKDLYVILKKIKPDVVQTWMYHANFIGGVAARIAGIKNVFWGIRQSTLETKSVKLNTVIIIKLSVLFAWILPRKIICCAKKALEAHTDMGYPKRKMVVVSNGYDFNIFKPEPQSAISVRSDLSLPDGVPVMGMVGRFDPLKNHFGLLHALQLVKHQIADFRFLLVGKNLNSNNIKLVQEINDLNLQNNIILLDQRLDIPAIMNALDLHVLSSISEAFPNVIAEAMACGVPCVTTDVGDAAFIVGSTGLVVPPRNPSALANAIIQALHENGNDLYAWKRRKDLCRERIINNFSIDKMIASYHKVWQN